MKITDVLGIATLNEYAECVPYFIRQWHAIFPEVRVRVVLVANAIPRFLQAYQEHIHLIPISWLPEGITREDAARQLRFLYPAWFHSVLRQMAYESPVILVSNIDTVPLQRSPFERAGELYDDTMFLQLLDTDNPETQSTFPVRYSVATSSVWRELFNASPDEEWSWDVVASRLKPVSSLSYFRDVILGSSLYPQRIRVVGNGRIGYDPNTSDYVLPLPIMAYQQKIENDLNR
jgi:hypothetical protein